MIFVFIIVLVEVYFIIPGIRSAVTGATRRYYETVTRTFELCFSFHVNKMNFIYHCSYFISAFGGAGSAVEPKTGTR